MNEYLNLSPVDTIKYYQVRNINNLSSNNIKYGDVLIYKDIKNNLPFIDGIYILKCNGKLTPYNIFCERLKEEYYLIIDGEKILIEKNNIIGFVVGLCRMI